MVCIPGSCPDGMTYYPEFESCYTWKNDRKFWQDAENYCQTFHPDGHIIEINSASEQNHFMHVMGMYTNIEGTLTVNENFTRLNL